MVQCERELAKRTEMMIGELARLNPTVQIPPWDPCDDPAAGVHSPYSVPSPTGEYLAAFHHYLPSNEPDSLEQEMADPELPDESFCDHFRMYVFKVKRCTRGRSHDWTQCPYAHPGEKARRRDPRRFHYSGTACPDFRKGVCKKGDSCEFAHGVFECWLHPDRYRTQPCKDGPDCRRRVCFFAHFPDQLRVLPEQQSPSSVETDHCSLGRLCPDSHHLTKPSHFLSSPTSVLTSPPFSSPADSPPVSPNGLHSVNQLVASMRGLSFGKSKLSPRAHLGSGFGLTRCSTLRPGSYPNNSLSTTPTRAVLGGYDLWEGPSEEEPAMERVESGRDIRAQMYARLSKDHSLNRVDPPGSGPGPDVGWVLELVK